MAKAHNTPVGGNKAASKRNTTSIPSRAEHQLSPPYNRLMQIGESAEQGAVTVAEIGEILRNQDPHEAVRKLIEIALDETYFEYSTSEEDDDPRYWTCWNALRTLETLLDFAEGMLEPLLALFKEEDEWILDEVSELFVKVGPSALPMLLEFSRTAEQDAPTQMVAIESAAGIVDEYKIDQAPVVQRLIEIVDSSGDKELVGTAVYLLCELDAEEALPLIRKAYAEDRVDKSVIDASEVEFLLRDVKIILGEETDPNMLISPAWREDVAPEPKHPRPVDDADEVDEEPAQQPFVAESKVGRNELCPCGSGKKYKKCCGAA